MVGLGSNGQKFLKFYMSKYCKDLIRENAMFGNPKLIYLQQGRYAASKNLNRQYVRGSKIGY